MTTPVQRGSRLIPISLVLQLKYTVPNHVFKVVPIPCTSHHECIVGTLFKVLTPLVQVCINFNPFPDTVPSSDDYSWGDALAIPPFEYAVLEDDRIETILEND